MSHTIFAAAAALSLAGLITTSAQQKAQLAHAGALPVQGGRMADDPARLVKALHAAFGEQHARAVHAKGIIVEGVFTPSREARALSRAALFAGPGSVVARFSDFTGLPHVPDNTGDSSPRGFAFRVTPAQGAGLDVVAHSFNGFPVRTAAEFGDLMFAIGASGPQAPKPTPLDRFLDAHPVAKTFLTSQKGPPDSYATLPYFSVNAFAFTGAEGERRFIRYRFVPHAGEHLLSGEAAQAAGPDYLQPELIRRLQKGAVTFDWIAQIAEEGDAIDDPSIAWPETRRLVKLGELRLTHVVEGQAALDPKLSFRPGTTPEGISPADPMLAIRNGAYAISQGERR